ncbi:hypothetical protein B9Z55_004876 [Caenorhabditis nigoni]|uniref:Uncharacterized protein n=1 Tax=Caenorhabditis nigoni TaxID=1611254 RepID=A0A2G5UYC3_9PELO|nr:hypothetical protein B9Z55_004876 [Caenorhabditis nigoni]
MPFPTLSQLAAKSVAQGIDNESISLNFTLDTKSSNAIVLELLKLDKDNFEKLERYKNQLSVTKIDLRGCEIDAEVVRNLSNFNLVSLDFGELTQFEEDYDDYLCDDGTLDIVNLLIQSTNNQSRRSIIHLGFSAEQELVAGWETEVSKILPNLQSINISSIILNERIQFTNFCTLFPNLLVLDISEVHGLLGLQGIKNLKNLQKLTMCYLEFDDVNGYKELSELKHLKYLDVSGFAWEETNPIEDMLAAGVRMKALEFLDCSWTSVAEHELETFAKNHPSLKTIAAICTACNQTTISGVKMLNMTSMSSLSECLEYTLLTDRFHLALDFIQNVFEKLETSRENLTNAELRHITNAVLFVLREAFENYVKFSIVKYYLESGLFEHELSISLLSANSLDMIEMFYNVLNKDSLTSRKAEFVFQMIEATVNCVRPGILIPDRVLSFVFEKTVDLIRQYPEHRTQGSRIIRQAVKWMSWEQILTMCGNFELFSKVRVFIN